LKVVSEYIAKTHGFDKVLEKITIVSGGDGACSAEFKVQQEHLNGGGGLHGGFIATLVDCISTYALMTHTSPISGANSNAGVSIDIHVSYLKGAREGEDIVVDAKTIKAGKTLAFLEVELKKNPIMI